MNNHSIQGGMKVGEWISEEGLEVENAFLWPYQTQIADDIVESGNVDSVVCVTPERRLHLGEHQDKITIGFIESHQYPGEGFDFEYGWAIAEDTRNALEPQIRHE